MTHARIPSAAGPIWRATTRQTPPADRPTVRPDAGLDEEVLDFVVGREVITLVRPDTAHVRAPRLLDLAGELLAAVALIGGGVVLTGLATLL